MRVAVVTAIYGGYDRVKPLLVDPGTDVFLYTDDYETGAVAHKMGYHVVLDERPDIPTPMLRAKFWKTHPLLAAPGYDVSIWIDGSMTMTVSDFALRCLAALGDDDVSFTPHPLRRCIYPEAHVTRALARYADCDPIAQVEFYRSVVGHPVNWGLFASGAFALHHNETVESWGKHWWDECVNWTYQDQLSLPVITRLYESKGLTWNTNLPWATWWGITEHGF